MGRVADSRRCCDVWAIDILPTVGGIPSAAPYSIGDLIDRGPEQLLTVSTVRRMVESGAGQCVMGNHEHNAIGWVTPDPNNPGEFCRTRKEYNRKQHVDFLAEVEQNVKLHAELIGWMSSLPVLLELGKVRVAHACWDEREVDVLRQALDDSGRFTASGLQQSLMKGTAVFNAAEIVMKGVEAKLPEGHTFVDPHGKHRDALRVAWWRPQRTFRELALPFPGFDSDACPRCSRA